ncbi:MAG: Tfp pilus assembly protein FimT/FimU [Candidatus Methylacidiphilales bacterium]|nr:prepilin-type N-terminal cleavage/methylation domain-containing protein [Candidatus Methylacidiphilales bacterium]
MRIPASTLRHTRRACSPSANRAFSLIELVMVMAMIGLMASFSVPALSSIAGARGVGQGSYDVVALLELARNEAVARHTYVWVGAQNVSGHSGTELQLAAVCSLDGSNSNTNAANLKSLTQVIRVRNVAMTPWQSLKSSTRALYTKSTPSSIADNQAGLTFTSGTSPFNGKTVTFTPRGQAILNAVPGRDSGYDPVIDISFRQSQGGSVQPEADDAAVLIDGSTGMSRILRF